MWKQVLIAMALCSPVTAQSPKPEFRPLRVLADSGALRTPVTLNTTTMSVQDALREVTRQAGIGITYRPDLPDLDKTVSAQLTRVPAATAIQRILGNTALEAWVSSAGNTVTLRVRPTSERDSIFTQRVDEQTNVPVIALRDVVVTPAHFGIAHEQATKPQTLTREQIMTLPQLGEDIYRTVNRLPGIGSNELSAKLNVRGSRDEDMLVLLDDLELLEPFHLKDFDSALSIIDVASVGGVDLTTGGFSVERGNRLAGVMDLKTAARIPQRARTSLGISLSNARVMSQGGFADGKGLWMASARRGYLDILLSMIPDITRIDPTYYDALGKVVYQLTPNHRIAARVLRAADDTHFTDDDGNGTLDSRYGSTYGWATWTADFSRRVQATTVASVGLLDWNRTAQETEGSSNFRIDDVHSLDLATVKQDWQLTLSERFMLRLGGELRHGTTEYDYFKARKVQSIVRGEPHVRFDSLTLQTAPEGQQYGVYVSQRVRPIQSLTLETGVRWDRQTYTDDTQVSPRLHAMFTVRGTTLRGTWGHYWQPQGLHQLSYRDGETTLHPAEKAVQTVVGVERRVLGVNTRIEAYRRNETNLRPRYHNLGNSVEPVSEVENDRVRFAPEKARAEGVEFMLHRQSGRKSWSATYALARAEDRLDGAWKPRPLEQRHTIYLDYSIAPTPKWHFTASWQYHSGWPSTPLNFVADSLNNGDVWITSRWGEYHTDRLPAYHRMDLRLTRDIPLKRGRLALFLDVFNLYDRANAQRYNYDVRYSPLLLRVDRRIEPLLPRLPTIGATWEF